MKLTVNTHVHVYMYIFLLCSIDLLIGNVMKVRRVAITEQSHVIVSVGERKELFCPTQKSSWYRTANVDVKGCPNPFILDSTVFCDRLTINRKIQHSFVHKFSPTPLGSENENGLIITKVELSDAGTYACISDNSNKIFARINLTVERDSTQTIRSFSKGSVTPPTDIPSNTSKQESDILPSARSSSTEAAEYQITDSSTTAAIFVCGVAIVCIIATIVIVVFLKTRNSNKERTEVESLKDVVSGNGHLASDQFSNNVNDFCGPVYDEIKDNGMVARSIGEDQITKLSPVYHLLKATDDDESGLRSAASAADKMKSDRKEKSNDAVQDQSVQNIQAMSIYSVVVSDIKENEKSNEEGPTFSPTTMTTASNPIYAETMGNDENETRTEGATFNPKTMAAFNPIYGETTDNDKITEANVTYSTVDKETTDAVDKGLCSNPKSLQSNSHNVGQDGTVYLELNRCNESGVATSIQQPEPLFQKSIYAMIDHDEKAPPAPPPALPRRSSCAPPR